MTRRTRGRAFTLMEIIGVLPILLALMIAAYGLTSRVEDMQCREAARRYDDVRIRDVVRRIQEDAARALEAAAEPDLTQPQRREPDEGETPATQPEAPTGGPAVQRAPVASRLTLRLAGSTVIYTATPEGITRTEQAGDSPPIRYDWALGHTQIGFRLEDAGLRSPFVWVVCTTSLTFDSGPDQEWRFAAVAPIGRGGFQ